MSKRILIVEDDVLIAMALAQDLENTGFEIVGPCRTVTQSLHTLKEHTVDAAVLDMSLGGETSAEVARTLNQTHTPFIVVSGYADENWPGPFANAPYLEKPYAATDLIVWLKGL